MSSPSDKTTAAKSTPGTEPPGGTGLPRSKHFLGDFSLSGVAGAAAVILGSIYAYGAVVKAGELHGAGLPVTNTLTLVPLEQILVAGIDKVIPIGVGVLVVTLIAMAFLDWRPEKKSENEQDKAGDDQAEEESQSRRFNSVAWVLTFLAWGFMAVASSWTFLLLLVELTVVSWYASLTHTTRRTYATFAVSALIVFYAASAWFDPSPLPQAQLTKRNGDVVKGNLIAANGSTWYVGTGDKEWVAVQAREFKDSLVKAVHKDQNESLYHALTGHRLFGLGPE